MPGRARHRKKKNPELPGAAAYSPASSSEAQLQPPQAGLPQSGAEQQPPQAQPPQSGAQLQPPQAQPPQSGAQLQPPQAQPPQSGAQLQPPQAQPPQSGAQLQPPQAQPPQSGAQLQPPQAQPPQSGAQLQPPQAQPPQLGTQPQLPQAQPPQSGAQQQPPQAGPPQAGPPQAGPPQLRVQLQPPRARPPPSGAQLWPSRERPPQLGAQLRPPRVRPPQLEAQLRPPRVRPPQLETQLRPPRVRPPQLEAQQWPPRALPPWLEDQQWPPQALPPRLEAQRQQPRTPPPHTSVRPSQPQAQPHTTWAQLVKPQVHQPQAKTQSQQLHVQPSQPEGASQLQFQALSLQTQEEGQVVTSGRPRGATGKIASPTASTVRHFGIFRDLVVNTRKELKHVKNSKRGTEGRVIKLLTNHYQVTCGCEIAYKYNIDYQPDIKDMNIRKSLLLRHESILGKCHIFDGNSLLLPRRLQLLDMELLSQAEGDSKVRIKIQLSSELHPNHPDWLRYYNILFRRSMTLMDLGDNDPNLKDIRNQLLASRMEIHQGYNTSILPYEDRLTLCADVTHRLFQKRTVYDLIAEKRENGVTNLQEEVSKEILGIIVYTKYSNKTYRVDGIDWNQTPTNTFKKFDGTMITFADYYEQQYNAHISDMNQPLLVNMGRWRKGQTSMPPREPVFLIPQLCYLTGVASEVNKNHHLMSQLTDQMRMNPMSRRRALKKFMNDIQTNFNPLWDGIRNQTIQEAFLPWSVTFDDNCLSVPGRILNDVMLSQRNESFKVDRNQTNWLRDSRSRALLRPKSLKSWVVLYTENCSREANQLVCSLREVTRDMHMSMEQASIYKVKDDPGSFRQVLQKYVSEDTQMVLCVLPDNSKQRYEEIKTFLCIENPIPSQCVVRSTLRSERNLKTKVAKIAQQMNCKMGGALWKVDTGMEKTMFVGIDCFHDVVTRQKSIAALVASTREDLSMWHSQCVFQDAGQEIVSNLQGCLQAALDSWIANEKQKPHCVVVYRDGVGDGQLQDLLGEEVRQFQKFLSPSIKLTFIVVKKRINTRFFVEHERDIKNPPSGTVVDQVLTRDEWYDFYIVSQSSSSGTVTPTHYNVIYDTKGLTPNQVQCLTYRLCHMYYNLPGIIRVPAPCHYAHKLAYFVGKSIHQEPASSLSEYLYYL